MEQGPESYIDHGGSVEAAPRQKKTFEQLLAESAEKGAEARPGKRSFEDLVHEALEEELRYERDPALRDQASQRADQIIAEFQEARQSQSVASPLEPRESSEVKPHNSPQRIAKQLGISADKLRQAARQRPTTSYGLPDLILAIVIGVLLLIVIFLLIF